MMVIARSKCYDENTGIPMFVQWWLSANDSIRI